MDSVSFMRVFEWLSELGEESEIVIEEVAEVIDAVSHHGDAFNAEAESESAVYLCIDIVAFEDVRVDESGAAEFDPFAIKEFGGGDGVIDAGFDEREEVGAESNFNFGAEHGAGEDTEGAFKMGHADAFIDHEAINLVKGVVVGAVNGFVAECATDGEVAEGWFDGFENARLEGRALSAENEVVGDVEGVLLVHCGVVGGVVETFEVVFESF